MDSPVRGSGSGAGSSVGVAVEAICSGVRGIGQGSFRLTAHEDKYRAGTILQRNTRLHEVARHNKADMVVVGVVRVCMHRCNQTGQPVTRNRSRMNTFLSPLCSCSFSITSIVLDHVPDSQSTPNTVRAARIISLVLLLFRLPVNTPTHLGCYHTSARVHFDFKGSFNISGFILILDFKPRTCTVSNTTVIGY